MRILEARFRDFRNLAHADLQLGPRWTALVGQNGQGKTNVLEAIYYCAALRPLRSAQRTDLIREGADRATIDAAVRSEHTALTHALSVELGPRSRRLSKDDKKADARAFLGTLTAVCFTPDDLQLTKASPDGRRRFLDRALLNLQPAYLDTAMRYARALKSRNKVLADGGPDALLDPYDEVLASEGAKICVRRAALSEELGRLALDAFSEIAHPAPEVGLVYRSTLDEALIEDDEAATREAFLTLLRSKRVRDRHRRSTSVGPHRDDLELELGGAPLKTRASQGQHRALVLALKLAEIRLLSEKIGEPPVLLLDDISSELDSVRSKQLFAALEPLEGQVLMTTTDPSQVPDRPGTVRYDVSGGTLERSVGDSSENPI